MFEQRKKLLRQLEEARGSRVMLYVTGDRPGLQTQISQECHALFVDHLDRIGVVAKISLVLYTQGGSTLAAWGLVNLLRLFCDELEIIVPAKAQSAGTLMALGADKVVMTKQATLGPIDPSIQGRLNPQDPGGAANARVPVSVESVNGFLEFARQTLGDKADMTSVFLKLTENLHPLVLGDAFRSRGQIRMLADRLLSNHLSDPDHKRGILDFLCSDSGSHDYKINRREAAQLHLPVEKPSESLYRLIKAIYDDFASELSLTAPLDLAVHLAGQATADYSWTRAMIESLDGGAHRFVSEGRLVIQKIPAPGAMTSIINDERTFEGWRHEAP